MTWLKTLLGERLIIIIIRPIKQPFDVGHEMKGFKNM